MSVATVRGEAKALTPRLKVALICLWAAVIISIAIWASFGDHAWDVNIYRAAISSLRSGHDPYADAIAIQTDHYKHFGFRTDVAPPYSYVYAPITLPLLSMVSLLPDWLSGALYWSLLVVGVLAVIWVGLAFVQPGERRIFLFLAPISPFFPGLLEDGTVMGGNVAYLLYGLILSSAFYGWRSRRWLWFHLAVLVASCFKLPFLTFLLLPPLSERRQWLPAIFAGAAGLGAFMSQLFICPMLFKHYLQAVELQFSYNRDFGASPAGIFAGALIAHHYSYSSASLIVYFCYAIPLVCALYLGSRHYFRGSLSLEHWAPILLVGIVLLNPRLQTYDAAAITLPLALIGWRFLGTRLTARNTGIAAFGVLFAIANLIACRGWETRKLVECAVVVAISLIGLVDLQPQPAEVPIDSEAILVTPGA